MEGIPGLTHMSRHICPDMLKSFSMKKPPKFDMERFFIALSDRTRLRILNLIGDDEVCVCFFVEVLEQGQMNSSRHLAYLRRAGLVAARRDGNRRRSQSRGRRRQCRRLQIGYNQLEPILNSVASGDSL